MIGAYHNPSKEYITAYKMLTDPEWIGRNKELFYAPTHNIINWDELNEKEIPVIFVRKSIDGRRPHWRINHPKAQSDSINESPEHRKIKEQIYGDLCEGIVKIKLGEHTHLTSDLKIKDITMEKRISLKNDSKIADVLITFKEFHPMLGTGIAIEVQLSKQSKYVEYERSYDRSSYGYSCCWIYRNNYDMYEKTKIIYVEPFFECIKKYNLDEKANAEKQINYMAHGLNDKIKEMLNVKQQMDLQIRNLNDKKEELSNELNNISNKIKEEAKEEYIQYLRNNVLPEIADQKNKILDESKKEITKIINEKVNPDKIRDELIISSNERVEKLSEELISNLKDDIEKEFQILYQNKINEFIEEVKKDDKFKDLENLRVELEKKLFESWRSNHLKFESYSNMVNGFFTDDLDKCVYWSTTLNDAINNPKHKLRENYNIEELKIMEIKSNYLINNQKKIDKSHKNNFNKEKEDGEKQTNIC